MDRRSFVSTLSAAGAGAAFAPLATAPGLATSRRGEPFGLKYAPHFGMFRHHAGNDPVDQIKFMADEGFRALEDNWMGRRPAEEQEKIAKAMEENGLEMGVFVAMFAGGKEKHAFTSGKKEDRDNILAQIRKAAETAQRVNAKWCTLVPGSLDQRVELDYQTAALIDTLRACCDIVEPAGLTMVLEPLNPWANHPGLLLARSPHAYLVCRGVDRPGCKILFDIYHQQITEGNLIPNMDRCWSELAYIQTGDNPGRREPGTGEINYQNIFRWLKKRNYDGILGMEHGNSEGGKEGERKVIEAYRHADS